MQVELHAIGVVRNGRGDPRDTPVQSNLNSGEYASIHIDERFADALLGLDGFDYVWLLCWFGASSEPRPSTPLRQRPYLMRNEPVEFGIFATRGPRRPNPIALSLVRLVAIDGLTITFAGVDMADGTIVVDIKPWVRPFDLPTDGAPRCGWFDSLDLADLTRAGAPTPRTLQDDGAPGGETR